MTLPTMSEDTLALNRGVLAGLSSVPASKYHNARAEAKGMTFQSGHEASGVMGLVLLEEQKQIFSLRLQVRFPLAGGVVYVADAVYLDAGLGVHICDFKGYRTREFINKAKQFKAKYGKAIECL